MIVYGLTGKTGAGKSTVASLLSKKGFFVIDGDLIARRVTEKGSSVLDDLAGYFGMDILLPDKTLDRKKLAARAFASKSATEKLCELTHPEIHRLFLEEIKKAEVRINDRVRESVEKGQKEYYLREQLVFCPEDIRLERILKRDNITRQQALQRMGAQKDDSFYLSQADIIINNYPPYDIEKETGKITKGGRA